jgi:dephospho-CoA kinase
LIYKVGVTGGIGSGKSSVTQHFADFNVPTFSSDTIARELCEPGQASYVEIVGTFGRRILNEDNTLNRAELGSIVFNDKAQLKRLEAILHPAIFKTMHERAQSAQSPYCILDIPLLVGTNEQLAVHRILVVNTDAELRKQRVMQRSGWSAEKTQSVMDNQLSNAELISAADDVIVNNATLAELVPLVKKLHQGYLTLARARNY